MPELAVTPCPESEPPSVRVRVDADEDTLITRAQVRRDGELVRGSVADRTPRLVIDDYEMPYATEVEYSVEGESVPTDVPLLDEVWDDLAEWDGDTGDWVLPASEEPVAENLVEDPHMQDVAAWDVDGPVAGWPLEDASLSVNGDGWMEYQLNSDPYDISGFASKRFSVPAGQTVHAGIDFRTNDFSAVPLALFFVDSNEQLVDSHSVSVFADGSWQHVALSGVVPAGADGLYVVPTVLTSMGEGGSAEFRNCILTEGADPVDFFTGDSVDTGRWHYEWSGVPGESTSLKFDKDQTPTLHSDVDDAAITHTTDVPFNTVTVENPLDVMVELIDVVDTEDGEETSVAVTIRSTGSGTTVQCAESGTVRTNGGGTYTASIMDGTLEVSGDAWTLDQPCTAEPSRIRITAMPAGHHYLGALDTGFELGPRDRIAVSDAYVFVLHYDEETVYRFDLDGGNETSWSLSSTAVDIAV